MSVDLKRFTYSCAVDNLLRCKENLEASLAILRAAGEEYVDRASDPDTQRVVDALAVLRELLSLPKET